jgi:hypothetical protein
MPRSVPERPVIGCPFQLIGRPPRRLVRPPRVIRVLQSPPCAARPHRASAAWSLCRRSSSNRGVVAHSCAYLGVRRRALAKPTDTSDGRASAAGHPQSNQLEQRFAPTLAHRPKPRRPLGAAGFQRQAGHRAWSRRSMFVPVLLLLPGQLNYLHVFDRVLADAERGTSQATPSQSRPPPRAVPRAPPRYPVCCATPSSPWTSSSPAGSCCTCSPSPCRSARGRGCPGRGGRNVRRLRDRCRLHARGWRADVGAGDRQTSGHHRRLRRDVSR